MPLGPVLGTCSFLALSSCNQGSDHDVSSLERMHHIGLETLICGGCVCPDQEAFLQLSTAEVKMRVEGGQSAENDER